MSGPTNKLSRFSRKMPGRIEGKYIKVGVTNKMVNLCFVLCIIIQVYYFALIQEATYLHVSEIHQWEVHQEKLTFHRTPNLMVTTSVQKLPGVKFNIVISCFNLDNQIIIHPFTFDENHKPINIYICLGSLKLSITFGFMDT